MFEAINTNSRNKASVYVCIVCAPDKQLRGKKRPRLKNRNPDSHPPKPKTHFAFCAINLTKKEL